MRGPTWRACPRFQYPSTIRVIRTMCSGRVDPLYVTEGLKSGFDGVLVFG